MFAVNQLLGDLQETLGTCETDMIFRRLNSALDLLQPMLPTDSNIGVMDICSQNCVITLPDDVEVPLAINVEGHPADFRNKWYEHQANGPGTECCGQNCTFGWQNQGLYPTFRDITEASQLFAMADGDEGTPMKSMLIFGEDNHGKPLYSEQGETGVMKPGLIIPIVYGPFAGSLIEGAPFISRISQIWKPATNNFVRLIALDPGHTDGTLIGYYRPDEQTPAYRRVMLSGGCHPKQCDPSDVRTTWARMRYQRRQRPISSVNDVIFVPSREALIFAVEAINQYRTNNKDEGDKYLNFARQALEEKQESLEGPNYFNASYPNGGTYAGDGIGNMI